MKTGAIRHLTELFRGRPDTPKTEPSKDTSKQSSDLIHRVKYTYRARLQMAKRLQSRNITWNTFLVTSSLVTTIISVVLLVDPSVYGAQGSTMLALAGLATFATSLLVTTANYSARSEILIRGYRDLQRLWAKLEYATPLSVDEITQFEGTYQQILDELPNHSEADYLIPLKKAKAKDNEPFNYSNMEHLNILISRLFTSLPMLLSVIFAAMLYPTILWILS